MKPVFILGLLFPFTVQILGEESSPIVVNFDGWDPGLVTETQVEAKFGSVSWERLSERASIVPLSEGRCLKVLFPKGKVGSKESGAQFVIDLPPRRVSTLRYRVKAEAGFQFKKGGKLPGLASGGSQFTGGRPPGKEGGWSARYMWRREGALELYFYHPKMTDQFGERHPLDHRLILGEWTELTQVIDVGDKAKRNGSLEVYVNRERALRLDGLALYGTKYGSIDSFLFSTFYGGSSQDWAPEKDTRLCFDDFEISCRDLGPDTKD